MIATVGAAAEVYAASYVAQFSPNFPNLAIPSNVVTEYPTGTINTAASLPTNSLSGFPTSNEIPSTTSSEVLAAYNSIVWSKVPPAPVRKMNSDGSWDFKDDGSDDYCWWSNTNCVVPKATYLPPDFYTCPTKGDWGLNYDDGPFNLYPGNEYPTENKYAEPALYNFLAKTNQKATLFVSKSNI